MMPMTCEQRQHLRLKAENTFAINQKRVCRVFDLSVGGVSFGCTSDHDITEKTIVDIIDNYDLQLFDIPIETVWIAKNNDMNTNTIYKTMIGAKFKTDLSDDQRSVLGRLLSLNQQRPQMTGV